MEQLGAILAIIVVGTGGLVLSVLAVMMMIGAIIPKRSEITSWPPQQEASFTPFNNRSVSSQGQAWMFSLIGGIAFFILIVGVYFGVSPEVRDVGKTMNMSNLTKRSAAPAPAPKPDAPAAAPVEKKDDAAPKAEDKKEDKKEEPKAEDKK
jgi:hypothetical protein